MYDGWIFHLYMCVLLVGGDSTQKRGRSLEMKILSFYQFFSLHEGRVSIYRLILYLNYMGCGSSLITGWDAGCMPSFGCRELLLIPENHLSMPCKKGLFKGSLDIIFYNHAAWCNVLEPVLIVSYLQMDESILDQWDELYSDAYNRQMEKHTLRSHESHSVVLKLQYQKPAETTGENVRAF